MMESFKIEADQLGINPYHSINFGDGIFALAAQGSPDHQKIIQFAKTDGATEEDIKFWWSLSYMQKSLAVWLDSILFIDRQALIVLSGKSAEQAKKDILSTAPYYSEYNSSIDLNDINRPLPYELQERVETFLKH